MAPTRFPYIEIAATDGVRDRLSAGDAVLVVDVTLDSVIFANGPGARFFGFGSPVDLTGNDPELGISAKRQILALGLERSGPPATIALRLTHGVHSSMAMVKVTSISLPDGAPAIMLSAASEGGIANAIDGLALEGSHSAIVDSDGEIVVASGDFSTLGVDQADLVRMTQAVQNGRDRTIKRRMALAGRSVPSALALLSENPPRYLLLVVDDYSAISSTVKESAAAEQPVPTFGKRIATVSAPPMAEDVAARTQAHVAADENSNKAAADTAVESINVDPESLPVRFTWKIDAAGFFSMISPEFGGAVGTQAADVAGRTFAEVAQAFAMDPSGEIRALLERHDTWSGRSVLWPIAGTALRAPVDLAALPVYDRDRRFEGFRGFGIVRLADAVVDPEAIGLALVSPSKSDAAPHERSNVAAPANGNFAPEATTGSSPALSAAQSPVSKLALPDADKVIRLEERRISRAPEPAKNGGLSPVERSAFREIAERLRREGLIAASERDDGPETLVEDDAASSISDPVTLPDTIVEAASPAHDATSGIVRGEDNTTKTSAPNTLRTSLIGEPDDVEEQYLDVFNDRASSADNVPDDVYISNDNYDDLTVIGGADEDWAYDDGDAMPEEVAVLEQHDFPAKDNVDGGQIAVPALAFDPLLDGDNIAPFEITKTEKRENGQSTVLFAADEAPVLSRLPVPILIHNGSNLLFANQAFFDLTGFASLDSLQKAGGLERLFVLKDEGAREASSLNSTLRTAYDETVPVRAHLHSVPWKGGHALLLSMRLIDTNAEIKNALNDDETVEALQQEVSELSSVLETATDGVVFVNYDGTIRAITQSGEALFGFDPAELKGKPFAILFASESQKTVNDYLANLSGTGVASLMNDGREVIGREAHGRFIPLFMTIGQLSGSTGFCAVMRDITQWKRAEEELNAARRAAEHASSQKSEFLARVSHEIRTPLNAIIGFSDLMTEERFGPVGNLRYLDYLKDINRSGRHVLDLVNDLLDISKIEAGQQEMDFEAVSLNESLAEAVSMMQPQANRNRVIIRSSFASDLPEVVADLRSVKQIALNLLSNAVRYTAAGGQVIVSTAYELTGGVVIRVRDTGIGMSPQEIEQAMKPFKQINALNRGRGEGTGLGLPLTKAMVEANRAKFTLTSTPGQGTLVEITFPSTRVLAD